MAELYIPKIAILASGSGSTAEAFIDATQDGRVAAEVGLVICSKPPEQAGIFARVDRLNNTYGLDIRAIEISGQTHPGGKQERGQTDEESEAICDELMRGKIDLVALMGYMRIVRGDLIEEYGWDPSFSSIYHARMINTHPGPLPETADTFGVKTSAKVLELGMSASRHTVHLVSSGVDTGPILAAHPVEVLDYDTPETLFDRVQAVEKNALPYAIGKFLSEQAASLVI